ncbi:hypothetical protein QEH56_24625, partial [Pelagicoccus enzymogenes]|uniref:hypothetical protein n=1 Tax=Pelagicoccus enzymogenes TaxID=2773457 RepID=UPI00281044BB
CPSGHSPSVPSQAQGGAARPETLLASIPNSTISSTQLEGRLPRRPRCRINTKPHPKPNVGATLVAKIHPTQQGSGRCPSGHSPSVPSQAQGGAARPETLLASIP